MVSQIITFIVTMLLHLWLVLHLRLIIAFMGDTKGLKGQYYYKLARIFRNVGGQTYRKGLKVQLNFRAVK